jgi:diguanylate cyclase (GGDEF)-like protein
LNREKLIELLKTATSEVIPDDSDSRKAFEIVADLTSWIAVISGTLAEANDRADELQRIHRQMLHRSMSLRERSMTDKLTSLYNRSFFERSMTYELERFARYQRPFGLIIFDIDYFKKVNDAYGHSVGDTALRHISDIATQTVRTSDILARWGGEEFVVLLPETNLDGTEITGQRLRKNIESQPLTVEAGVLNITISLGITAAAIGYKGVGQSLIDIADEALYEAKRAGRNRAVTKIPDTA